MSNSEQDQAELETASLEHAIGMGEAWKRLQRNGDFKKIIIEGYLKEKVLASVSLLAVPQIKQRGERPEIVEDLISASNLQYFFQIIEHQYEGATQPILSDDEMIEATTTDQE
ncbi:MAG: hypothetical protein GY820_10480 [Gammaproteobacteria bacterium]|nr:hypothetical protein [Gammaproteobacteria bacterium]